MSRLDELRNMTPGEVERIYRVSDAIGGEIVPLYRLPRWIPVSERLPELDERVMVSNAGDGWVTVGSRQLTGEYHHWDGDDSEELHTPTHWMPLPEPPTNRPHPPYEVT